MTSNYETIGNRQFHPVYGLVHTIGTDTANVAVVVVTLGMGASPEMPRYNSVWSRADVATAAAGVCLKDSMGEYSDGADGQNFRLGALLQQNKTASTGIRNYHTNEVIGAMISRQAQQQSHITQQVNGQMR